MVVGLMSRFSRRSSVHLREKTLAGQGPSTHEPLPSYSDTNRASQSSHVEAVLGSSENDTRTLLLRLSRRKFKPHASHQREPY